MAKKKNTLEKSDKSIASRLVKIIGLIVLITYSISLLFPLSWGLMTSLKSNYDFQYFSKALGLPIIEHSHDELFYLKNYADVFNGLTFRKRVSFYIGENPVTHSREQTLISMIFNSLFLAGSAAGMQTLLSAIMGFILAKYPYKSSKIIYMITIFTLTIPIVGTMPSMLEFMRATGLYDTPLGWICQNFHYGGIYFLVFFSLFEAMPNSYTEAAEIDGANQYAILFRIILPLQINVIGTVFLIQFVAQWNQYQNQMIYMPTYSTLSYGVYRLVNEVLVGNLATVPGRLATCMLLAIPVLILFIILKDKMMGNVTMGGIKG